MKKITVNLVQGAVSPYDIYIGVSEEGKIASLIATKFAGSGFAGSGLSASDVSGSGLATSTLAVSEFAASPGAIISTMTAVISDENVAALYGESFLEALRRAGVNAALVSFPAGETSKKIGTITAIAERLLSLGLDRSSKIIALGGGVVGDVAGFIASIYMRGIPHVQIPTTLIAQTDSSIGGKTGVDLPQGKNLLGTFFQPAAVFIDVRFLETLTARDFSNGMAEVIKYGLLDGEGFFSHLENNITRLMRRDLDLLIGIVERCCRIKKDIVEVDEREKGARRFLNLGHTIGHALEAASGYHISHGEAVAIGMVAALRISGEHGKLPAGVGARVEKILSAAGLPIRLPDSVDVAAIMARLKADKKKEGARLHFVLLQNIGLPFLANDVPDMLLSATLEGLRG